MKKTVTEIAKERGVSERAIYKQIKTHEKKLEGHIEVINGKKWLDEYAVGVLKDASSKSVTVYVEDVKKSEVERLKAELEELKQERFADQRALRIATETMAELVKQHNEDATLIAESKLYIEQRDNAQKELEKMSQKCEALESELGRFKGSWFGWYRKE